MSINKFNKPDEIHTIKIKGERMTNDEIKEELGLLNYKADHLSGRVEGINDDLRIDVNNVQKAIEHLTNKITHVNLELKVEIVKYISENAWKTVGLLLGAQTGMLAIFGFVQNFMLQK